MSPNSALLTTAVLFVASLAPLNVQELNAQELGGQNPDAQKQLLTSDQAATKSAADTKNEFIKLFDGKTFEGWDGDKTVFRIENAAIVGGQLKAKIPHNYFLECDRLFADFELRLQFKLRGKNTNAGVQIRSKRIPDHHEMIGYQADLGQNYWGCLYDESRRRKVLAGPEKRQLEKVLKKEDWNDYRIVCRGPRIQLFINDMKTVDFVETDPEIPLNGRIAVQIHGGPAGEAWYRNIRIRELDEK
ncbi:MAG: DUF1080 domain-containing protein [Fuerstiella sp.]